MSLENTTPVELALVSEVMKNLEAGDTGKINKFFQTQVDNFTFNIKQLDTNKQTFELQHSNVILKTDKDIEDAKADLLNAYTNISPKKVANNAQITEFGESYWTKITAAQDLIDSLETKKTALNNEQAEKIKKADALIAVLNTRISMITNFK